MGLSLALVPPFVDVVCFGPDQAKAVCFQQLDEHLFRRSLLLTKNIIKSFHGGTSSGGLLLVRCFWCQFERWFVVELQSLERSLVSVCGESVRDFLACNHFRLHARPLWDDV